MVAAIGEPPGALRGHRAGEPDEPEQADRRVAVVVGAPGEQERDRRPQDAELPHPERAVEHPHAQRRLLDDEPPDRPQQAG